jgi:hypothetical protein
VALVGILLTFMFLLDKRREPMPETEAATGALAEQV